MSLQATILADYQDAMRAREADRIRALRLLRAALKSARIEARRELTDDDALAVLQRQAKQRRDSIEAYRQAGRNDLVEAESAELRIITTYLPVQLSDDELRQLAAEAVATVGATSPRDLGQVMKVLMPQVQGRADGKRVSESVRELLGA